MDWQILYWLFFRPGMLVFQSEQSSIPTKETIHAFVNGYEHGRERREMFGAKIADVLQSRFGVVEGDVGPRTSMCWERHIDDIATDRKTSWFEVFREIGAIVFENADVDLRSMNPRAEQGEDTNPPPLRS